MVSQSTSEPLREGDLVRIAGFKEVGTVVKIFPDGIVNVRLSVRTETKKLKLVRGSHMKTVPVPEEDRCCSKQSREKYPLGTVGKIHAGTLGNYYLRAVVLQDLGTDWGGGDDIKAAINVHGPEDAFQNEWKVWWIGGSEFLPDGEIV
jgi:hypothetical protein